MTLEQIRAFLAVVDTGQVTGAAERIGRTQSAISAAISALERRHNVRLFDRVGRNVVLTADGRRFIPVARDVLAKAAEAETLLSDIRGEPAGPLTIVASQTVASYWLPPHLARFAADHPKVEPVMLTRNTSEALEMVTQVKANLAVVEGSVDQPGFTRTTVARDRLAMVVSRSHPWADRKKLSYDDLRSGKWVLRETGSGTRASSENFFAAHSLAMSDLGHLLEMPSNEACLAATSSGLRVTIVSRLASEPHVRAGLLAVANVTLPEREFSLVAASNRHQSLAHTAFSTMLTESGRT